jgi:hypothetical protein
MIDFKEALLAKLELRKVLEPASWLRKISVSQDAEGSHVVKVNVSKLSDEVICLVPGEISGVSIVLEEVGGDLARVCNATKDPIRVAHASLERWSDSAYKSKCPACKDGLLLIYRDVDFKLVRLDRCVSCGQQVYYTDDAINGETFSTTVGS